MDILKVQTRIVPYLYNKDSKTFFLSNSIIRFLPSSPTYEKGAYQRISFGSTSQSKCNVYIIKI